jgi:hypothetical protein
VVLPRRGLISREVGDFGAIAALSPSGTRKLRCAVERRASVGAGRRLRRLRGDRVDIAGLVHVFEFRDECIESMIGPRRGRLGPIVFAGLETAEMRMLVLLARAALPRDGPGCDGACIYSDEITLVPILSDEDIEVLFIWMER